MPSGKLESRVLDYGGRRYVGNFLPGESLDTVFQIVNPEESCLPEAMGKMLESYDTFGLTNNGRQVGLTVVEEAGE